MLPHGGPESYDRIGFDWLAQALANQGYLVIQPQFRGSSGFGVSHVIAGRGEWGKKMQQDITDGVAFFKRKGIIDPERICIAGISYGGYAALAGATFTPDLFKCAISINGVSELNKIIKDEKYEHGRDSWVVSYWKYQMTGDEQQERKSLREVSPANFAAAVKAPVLLIHGKKDRVVNVNQSKLMYKQLQKENKASELVLLKGEDHYLSGEETRLSALKAVVEFLNKHIGK